jgi:hypothetical protein
MNTDALLDSMLAIKERFNGEEANNKLLELLEPIANKISNQLSFEERVTSVLHSSLMKQAIRIKSPLTSFIEQLPTQPFGRFLLSVYMKQVLLSEINRVIESTGQKIQFYDGGVAMLDTKTNKQTDISTEAILRDHADLVEQLVTLLSSKLLKGNNTRKNLFKINNSLASKRKSLKRRRY